MQVQRTLVKSSPELWAEISDVEALTRHLEELGPIRITRVVPETEVAWEGDAASGTVELDSSGWGTKVTLKAEAFEPEPVVVEVVEPEVPADDVPSLQAELTEAMAAPAAVVEPEAEPEPAWFAEPVADALAAEPEPEPKKPGFFARLFGRTPAPVAVVVPEEPVAVDLPPSPAPPTPAPDPGPPPAPAPDPTPPAPEPDPAPPQIHAPADLEAVLTGVLDALGAAHHRPFSRS